MTAATFILVCAITGLATGIVASIVTGLPFMPEAGAIAGVLVALYLRRDELQADKR